jgi:hypothetical protein
MTRSDIAFCLSVLFGAFVIFLWLMVGVFVCFLDFGWHDHHDHAHIPIA